MSTILETLSDNVVIDKHKCIFCGKCAEVCLLDNIRLQLAPCREACPLGVNCQGYTQLIARGDYKKALEVIQEDLPFVGIIGRICHHPCEIACNRNEVDNHGVALRQLKRFLADNVGLDVNIDVPAERDKRVAVIGGGPAGLMAAYRLRKEGFRVCIYEAASRLGGLLASCIPEYRLPSIVVQREVSVLEKMGIDVKCNTRVGTDVPLSTLVEDNDAVIITTGAQVDKKLSICEGEKENVFSGLEFLSKAKTNSQLNIGKDVIVIGGGNSAINAAQAAYRLGARTVRIVCLESRDEMLAFPEEIEQALAEGIIIENGWGPKGYLLDQGNKNKVIGVEFKRCLEVFNQKGQFDPLYVEGEKQAFTADTVIVAIGQQRDLSYLAGTNVQFQHGYVEVDPVTYQTSIAQIFAAGDVINGPSSVIDAMAQGREVAESIRRMFSNIPIAYDRGRFNHCVTEFEVDFSNADSAPRVHTTRLEGEERRSFKELEKCLSESEATTEAKRCLSCGVPYGKHRTCWSCLPCEVECPEDALWIDIPYLMR